MTATRKPIVKMSARELIAAVKRTLGNEELSDMQAAAGAFAIIEIWEQAHPLGSKAGADAGSTLG